MRACLALMLIAGCHGSDGSSIDLGTDAAGPTSTDVPLRVDELPAGIFFSIQVTIGDAPPIDALLDTGSAGLRILPGAVPDSAIDAMTSTALSGQFGSGVVTDGVVAMARVGIGDRTTSSAIPIMYIQNVSCAPATPNCPAMGFSADQFSFAKTYKAIFGVGTRNGQSTPAIGDPIVQLDGEPAFIIRAPSYGGDSGTLHIAPTASEIAAFKTLQLAPMPGSSALPNGVAPYADTMVPICVTDKTMNVPYCTNGLLDCGSTNMQVRWSAYSGTAMPLPSGTNVDITVGPAASPITDFMFTVGASPTPGLDEVNLAPGASNMIILGTAAFFRHDVLIDGAAGKLGLLPH